MLRLYRLKIPLRVNSFSMRRTMIAPEHKKFFQINGFIAFDGLTASSEMKEIQKSIQSHKSNLPGLSQENLVRAIPSIFTLAHKLSKTAGALLDRKPIRLKYDAFLEDLERLPLIEERELGLLLLPNGKGVFFTNPTALYNEPAPWYLLLIFTANYVNNPILFA